MELNEKLYELRKKNNWSQEELAEKLNVSRQTISKWESNKAIPELDKLVKLSEIYNITLDELIKNSIQSDNVTFNSTKKSKKKLKIILIIFLIFIILFIIIFSINMSNRISIITDISKYYKENFQSIGVTKSGYVIENITERDLNNINENYNKYFYYVSENGEKLVKIQFYEDINSDNPLKETYIDLTKENIDGLFDNVTEIDKTTGTRKIIDNYQFDSPIRKATDSLNNYYSLICAGNNVISDKEMAFDFNNKLSKKENVYSWSNNKINNSKDNISMILRNNNLFLLIFDNYEDDTTEEKREILKIQIDTTYIPTKEEVSVPEI